MSEAEQKVDLTQAPEIISFFDLLAQFDYEDRLNERSALNSGPSVSAPEGSELGSDS